MSSPIYVKEFPYDLWTTEDGRCWVRIRETGETTEVSRDVMRELRREEKQLWRHSQPLEAEADFLRKRSYDISHPLSLDAQPREMEDDTQPAWLVSPHDTEDSILTAEIEQQLIESLTERQRDCYYHCVVQGEGKLEYAKRSGISARRVTEIFSQIQQKLRKLI